MALQTLTTIKNWFTTGLKPTQTQFWDTWDSFRHKNEKVPVEEVDGIDQLLDQLPPKTIYKTGQLLIFKNPDNVLDSTILEPNDTVIGHVEGEFLNSGTYYGGDPMLLSSYTQSNNQVGRIIAFNSYDQYNGDVITYELNDEVLQRAYSCGAYNGVYIMYKRPGDLDFLSVWPSGSYPQAWVTWLELTPGTIIKLTDTIGGLNDSEEYIVPELAKTR